MSGSHGPEQSATQAESDVDTGTTKKVVTLSEQAPQVFEYEPTEIPPDPADKKVVDEESAERKKWLAEVMSVAWGIREPVKVLDEVSFECVARCMREGKFHKIMVMAGAGISTSAGIPDYRSPVTGMYEQLKAKHPQLTCMEDLFSIQFFLKNPVPFFQRSKPFFQISLKPTPCHYFIRLLHEKGILLRHYTQNIDILERVAGLPADKVVEAHGSYFTSHCQGCDGQYDFSWLEEKVLRDLVPICDDPDCSAVVKPDIVLFNETLGTDFSLKMEQDTLDCDLLLIMGTALAVQPFASLTAKVKISTPRVYINMDRGNTGKKHPVVDLAFGGSFDFDEENNYRDVFKEGKCDDAVYEMADIIGWGEELRAVVAREHARIETQDKARGKLTSLPISQFFDQVTLCENGPLAAGSGEPSAVKLAEATPSQAGAGCSVACKGSAASGKRAAPTGKTASTVGKSDTAAGKATTSNARSTTSGAAKANLLPSVRRRSNTSNGKTVLGNVRTGGASTLTTAGRGSSEMTSVAKDNVCLSGQGLFSSATHHDRGFSQTAADADINFDNKLATDADVRFKSTTVAESEPSESKPVNDTDIKPSNDTGNRPHNANSKSVIEPCSNSAIKLVANSDIKPVANSKIKPVANSKIKPVANSKIKPVANSKIKPVANSQIKPVANAQSKAPSKPVTNVNTGSGKPAARAGKSAARGGNLSAIRGKGQSSRAQTKPVPGRSTSLSSRPPLCARKN